MSAYACDTSVAVPLLLRHHRAHEQVAAHLLGHTLRLVGHAVAETYAVLTRLPGKARLAPADAATLLAVRFGTPVDPPGTTFDELPQRLADVNVAGGAVYDALVGLAAQRAALPLATRDLRAKGTYERLGVEIVLIGR